MDFGLVLCCFFLFKQKPAYEMRIRDWSSDVCSSDRRRRAAVAAETFTPGGESQRITISIGIAELSSAHDSRAGLMAAADAALYRAKEEGRNRVCVES